MSLIAETISENSSMSQLAVYEMAAIMASSTSIQETLDLTLETVAGMMKAERAFIMLIDPNVKELFCAAVWGVDNESFGAQRLKLGEGIAGWVARSGKAYAMQGREDPRYVKSPGSHRDFKSLLCVPLKVERHVVGVLGVGSLYESRKHSAGEISTLSLISSLAALAIENAFLIAREKEQSRLLSESNRKLKTRSRQLVEKTAQLGQTNRKLRESLRSLEESVVRVKALYEIGAALSSTLNLKTIMNSAIAGILAMASFPVETVIIARLDEAGSRFVVESAHTPAGKPLAAMGVNLSQIPPRHRTRLIKEKQPLFLSDLSDEPEVKKIFFARRLKSIYIWPLIARGKVTGCMAITCARRSVVAEEELETIGVAARQIGIAVENAHLYEESQNRAVALSSLNQLLSAIYRSMGDGVMTVDWERRVTTFNEAAERITGYSAAEVLGKSCAALFYGSDQHGINQCQDSCPLLKLFKQGENLTNGLKTESVIKTRDGEEKNVSSIHSILMSGEEPIGGVVVFRDVTREKALEKMRSDLVASISHDVRTPLTSIKGYVVSLLRKGEQFDRKTKEECLKITNSEIDRLTRLLDNLLNLSRLEAGRLVPGTEVVNLVPLVKKVVELNRVNLFKHSILNKIAGEVPDVIADPDQLEQVLNNLLSNAVKYSPEGGEVRLQWESDGRFIRICVADKGIGIPPGEQQKIFEQYHRCDSPAVRGVAGTGLGLYITKKLVELQGGRIWVESAPSSGSRFCFTIPRAAAPREGLHLI